MAVWLAWKVWRLERPAAATAKHNKTGYATNHNVPQIAYLLSH